MIYMTSVRIYINLYEMIYSPNDTDDLYEMIYSPHDTHLGVV